MRVLFFLTYPEPPLPAAQRGSLRPLPLSAPLKYSPILGDSCDISRGGDGGLTGEDLIPYMPPTPSLSLTTVTGRERPEQL